MTVERPKQHVILCEGFDDRSFWAGWLLHLDCRDPTDRGKKPGIDAWGRPVKGRGQYLFLTPADTPIIVHPFQGRDNVRMAVGEYLEGQVYRPDRMVINLDSDAEQGSNGTARDVVTGIVRHFKGEIDSAADGFFDLESTRVASVIWECEDPHPTPGVPGKQTLERLVAASIQAAYPRRGPVVDGWLTAEPVAGATSHKNYGYSYLAKWYAKHGPEDFYRELWRDPAVARELRKRLESTGAWTTVQALIA